MSSQETINVQLQEGRERFTEIAESHEILQSLAEAVIKQADTAKIIAENYCQLNVLNKQKLILKEKQLQIDENLLQVLDNVHGLIEKILNKHT